MFHTTVASGLLAAACSGLSGGGGAQALGREAGTVSCCIVPGSLQALSEFVIGGSWRTAWPSDEELKRATALYFTLNFAS